jgi:hypothetical protein
VRHYRVADGIFVHIQRIYQAGLGSLLVAFENQQFARPNQRLGIDIALRVELAALGSRSFYQIFETNIHEEVVAGFNVTRFAGEHGDILISSHIVIMRFIDDSVRLFELGRDTK